MHEDTKPSSERTGEIPTLPAEPLTEEEQMRIVLEQAWQDVKRIAKQEREGERINRELLNFRMRKGHDS